MKVRNRDQLAEEVSRASEWGAELEEAWKLLPFQTAMMTHLLVDSDRTVGAKLCCLRITDEQKVALQGELRTYFATAIAKNKIEGQLPPEAAAVLLWQFLQTPWKTAESQ
jgi:hypothetical protein